MPFTLATPKLLVAGLLALVALFLLLALPASSSAAPEEGPGLPLEVSPSPIVVPKTTVGYNGAALELQITNPGEEAFIDKVTLEGEETNEFFVNGGNCSTLTEAQKCSFYFGLKPTTVGTKQATLTITFQGGRAPESFPVYGESVPASLSFSPASYDFGLVRANRESVSQSFQVINAGEAPVQVFGLGTEGDEGFWVGGNSCQSLLMPGETCAAQVYFSPNDVGEYESVLRAWTGGDSFTVALAGEGGRALVVPSANPVDFGSVGAGTAGEVKTIAFENVGSMSGAFFIAVIAGGGAGSFQLLDETCSMVELEPGDTCEAQVRFAPLGVGTQSARLALFGDDEPTMVFLEGGGIAGVAEIVPGATAFGKRAVGKRSASRVLTVRNVGVAALEIHGVSSGGADLDQFVVSGDECTDASLPPGGECQVRVRFAPDSVGAKVAQLQVRSSAPTVVATLSGTGKPRKQRYHRSFIHGKVLRAAEAGQPRALR